MQADKARNGKEGRENGRKEKKIERETLKNCETA